MATFKLDGETKVRFLDHETHNWVTREEAARMSQSIPECPGVAHATHRLVSVRHEDGSWAQLKMPMAAYEKIKQLAAQGVEDVSIARPA